MNWKAYQQEAADFFRSLGLSAETDIRVHGARTTHDVDVLVTSRHVGFEVRWVVECKQWSSSVSKLHVLALRQIVTDLGADRGILLSESGFQSGALEAANMTNIQVTSLAEAREQSSHDVNAMRLRDIFDRIESCKIAYWNISKSKRIQFGLRPDLFESGYSGTIVIGILEDLVRKSLRGRFPFDPDLINAHLSGESSPTVGSSKEAIDRAAPMLVELENKIARALQNME